MQADNIRSILTALAAARLAEVAAELAAMGWTDDEVERELDGHRDMLARGIAAALQTRIH